MDDAAVVPGLMPGEFRFFLEDEQARGRMRFENFERGGQAQDTAADDREIVF
jgi:hypothetical protein